MISPPAGVISLPTASYLSKATENYITVLNEDTRQPARDGIQAMVRFHYLKLHPITGKPMLKELIEVLYDQLAEFCLKAGRVNSAQTSHEHLALHREARSLLRRYKTGGEAGELLAYFLIESVLDAPQLVAKMDLKTNTKLESFGADGLHFKWNDSDRALEIYCAESKLEEEPSAAVSNLVKSLTKFHLNEDYETELRLATAHFKHADEVMRDAVHRILQNREPEVVYRLRHACLAGYDWKGYTGLKGKDVREREKLFRARYSAERERLHSLIQTHFPKAESAAGSLVAFDVFFLPFQSVQAFRDAFNKAVE